MNTCRSLSAVLILVTCFSVVIGFYVPGVAPRDYVKGEDVEIKVQIFEYFVFMCLIVKILLF